MAYPNPLIVLLKGQQTLSIANVASEAAPEDIDFYDGTTYRDILPGSYLGRGWREGMTAPFVSPGDPEAEDDIFNHVAPRFWEKKRTMFKWLDSGGTVVGKCWADQFVGYGDDASFVE